MYMMKSLICRVLNPPCKTRPSSDCGQAVRAHLNPPSQLKERVRVECCTPGITITDGSFFHSAHKGVQREQILVTTFVVGVIKASMSTNFVAETSFTATETTRSPPYSVTFLSDAETWSPNHKWGLKLRSW